jgi:protein-glutamine gamma-glutamyltransferase
MTFAQYFKASSYCLIGSGFLAIAATGAMDRISLVLFAAVFIGSWFLDTTRIRKAIPGWGMNCFGLVLFLFCIADARLFTHSFMRMIFHLLFLTAAVKLLTLSKDRDYLMLYLISFTELLASSTLTVSIGFVFCFLIFLFAGISTLIVFEMRRTNERMRNQARIQPLVVPRQLRGTGLELFSPFPAGLLSAMVIGITALILAAAVPIFFLLPRMTLGMYKRPSGSTRFTSGFSEQVELGQIGEIKQSDEVVMRVKTDKPPQELPFDLKWRGISFDFYDGRSWKRTDRTRRPISAQGWYYKLEDSAQGMNLIRQTFFVEALSTDVIFATHKVLAVSKDVGLLWKDSSESLYTVRPAMAKIRYFAVSDPIRPDPANISDLRPIPPEILKPYTQIPPEDPRIAELAKRVTSTAKDRYAKAQMLETYLRTHYGYSLVLRGTPNSPDPLAMFLFDVRKGHCEYFASALAIMLRQLGIPARLVNGFRAGEYNSLGNNWIVRQYDAHSWVEAYFPPYGWVEFDPTPTELARPKPAFLRAIANLADAIDLWWWDGVVNYDQSKQYRVVSEFRSRLEAAQNRIKAAADAIRERFRAGIAWARSPGLLSMVPYHRAWWILLIIPALLLLIRPLRKRISAMVRRTVYRKNSRVLAVSFYSEALAILSARGFRREHGQTPIEFASDLGEHPAGVPFLSLTRMYNAVRFGPPGTSFNHWEAEADLHALRTALKKPEKSS